MIPSIQSVADAALQAGGEVIQQRQIGDPGTDGDAEEFVIDVLGEMVSKGALPGMEDMNGVMLRCHKGSEGADPPLRAPKDERGV